MATRGKTRSRQRSEVGLGRLRVAVFAPAVQSTRDLCARRRTRVARSAPTWWRRSRSSPANTAGKCAAAGSGKAAPDRSLNSRAACQSRRHGSEPTPPTGSPGELARCELDRLLSGNGLSRPDAQRLHRRRLHAASQVAELSRKRPGLRRVLTHSLRVCTNAASGGRRKDHSHLGQPLCSCSESKARRRASSGSLVEERPSRKALTAD